MENTVKKPYQIRIDEDLLEQVKLQAKQENRSINNMIEELIARSILNSMWAKNKK